MNDNSPTTSLILRSKRSWQLLSIAIIHPLVGVMALPLLAMVEDHLGSFAFTVAILDISLRSIMLRMATLLSIRGIRGIHAPIIATLPSLIALSLMEEMPPQMMIKRRAHKELGYI